MAKTMVGATFETARLCNSYPELISTLLHAPEQESRLGGMREMLDFTLVLHEPEWSVVDREGFSPRFMMAEAEQFLAGVHDGDVLANVSPQASSMITEETSYAGRIGPQMPWIINELKASPHSRRAVAYVGHPEDLEILQSDAERAERRANEIACACCWQFLVRDGKLVLIVSARSWDAVWGLCYDITSATAVQMAVARVLGVEVGPQIWHAGSFHLYERHYDLPRQARPDGRLELDLEYTDYVTMMLAYRTKVLKQRMIAHGDGKCYASAAERWGQSIKREEATA